MKKTVICALVLNLIGAAAYAGSCEMTTHREACAGKEDKAFAPYKSASNPKGDPTVETKPADSADKCKEMATAGSKIKRKRELAMKSVSAKFDGQDVGTFKDQTDCK
ncbi:MAG: hypothetical protein ACJ763_12800 [Bdellovibrionia bacterium]